MARYVGKLLTTKPVEELFDYMCDFSNAQEWDPGTLSAVRLDEGPVAVGSRFSLRTSFLGRESLITYEVVELDCPGKVVFRGENSSAVSVDTLTLTSSGHDTALTYDAHLRLKPKLGVLFEPLLALAFRRVGDQALKGLRARLSAGGLQTKAHAASP